MLHLHQLAHALESNKEKFRDYEDTRRRSAASYDESLRQLARLTAADVARLVAPERAPGALPSTELDSHRSIGVRFHPRWRSHEDSRRWAIDVLHERTTFAADGSQIMPGRDISTPLAAVQVAGFENPHTRDGEYIKEAELRLLTPDVLLKNDGVSNDAFVSLNRFQLEVEVIERFLEKHRGWEQAGRRMPLAFLDGTLMLQLSVRGTGESDAGDAAQRAAEGYIATLKHLVETSRDTRVPVVGYIDQSYARDIVVLLNTLKGAPRSAPAEQKLFDAQLLTAPPPNDDANDEHRTLDSWGARTIFFHCLRRGLVDSFVDDRTGAPLVGFVYLQTVTNAAPARLDIPAWIYDANLLDEVADTVRAECVVGNGYPYAIETADAAAAINPADREQFLRIVGEFSRRAQLDFRIAHKRQSKSARR